MALLPTIDALATDRPERPKSMIDSVLMKVLVFGTGLLIMIMPLASGARGLSLDVGRAMLAGCDAALILLFFLSFPIARARLLKTLVVFMLAHSLIFMLQGSAFPGLADSYQGLRKSILWLLAICVGSALTERSVRLIVNIMLATLVCISLYGIKQYFIFSTFDQALLGAQSANIYANKIAGATRAISVLSSGFHLGMAGCILICIVTYHTRLPLLWKLTFYVIALFAIYASLTRTFLIISAAVLILPFLARSGMRTFIFALIGLTVFTGLMMFQIDLAEIAFDAAMNDDRFTSRGDSYAAFFEYLRQSPIGWLIGFGPGTAGSTLGDTYVAAGSPWIEPHNIFTKYIFEYGAPLAICLFAVLAIMIGTQYRRPDAESPGTARLAIFVLCMSGLTITSVETWPVSLYIGLLIGMLCRNQDGSVNGFKLE
jgi:O-antigen ligase